MGSDNLSRNLIRKGMWLDIKDTFIDIRDLGLSSVDFHIVFPLTDIYGNTSNEVVMKVGFSKEVLSKINWDGFSIDNIPNVSTSYWEHGALNS
jgi:hypothetical protein